MWISTYNECGRGISAAVIRRITWWKGGKITIRWRWRHKISQERYRRSDQMKSDRHGWASWQGSCSGTVSDLSSFAHLAVGGAPRGFLIPRLCTAPTNTRARPAPRPRHHNLHRVHLSHRRRLAPARIGRRRWRCHLASGR
jgi:hypothetical protein